MQKGVFLREATGLTRPIGASAAWLFAVGVINIGVGGAQMFGWTQTLFPGANIPLTFALCTLFYMFHAALYAVMGSAMPRSGGDYVWVSRIAHPAVGFIANWMYIAYVTLAVGTIMSYLSYIGLTQLFLIVGTLEQNSSLIALSQLAATPTWMVGFGLLLILAITIILQFPTKIVFSILWVCFVIAMAGWLTMMAMFAFSSLDAFKAGFLYYTGLTYDSVIANAKSAGYSYAPSLSQTVAALTLATLTISGYETTAYVAGEVKRPKNSLLVSCIGSLLFAWIIYSATALLLDKTVGMGFLGSIGQLVFITGAQPYTYSYITFIASVLTRNVFLAGWICISFIFWIIIIGVVNMFYITRCIFAWSFDRMIPSVLAHVSDSRNTPTYAILVGAIGLIVGLVLTVYTPYGVFMNFGLGLAIGGVITGLVCAAFPFVKKELYHSASVKGPSIAGMPFITVCGLIVAGFFSLLIYLYIQNPALAGPIGPAQWAVVLANMVFCVAVYYGSRWYHKRIDGIDIGMAFKTIPPE